MIAHNICDNNTNNGQIVAEVGRQLCALRVETHPLRFGSVLRVFSKCLRLLIPITFS